MRLILSMLLLIPSLGICQTFEKVISENNFQYPVDIIELDDGYLLLTREGNSDDKVVQSSIYKFDKQGKVLNRKIFDDYYIDKLSNILILDNNTYLVVSDIYQNETVSMKFFFRIINSNLEVIKNVEIETMVPGANYDGFISKQAELIKTENSIIYAFGYHAMGTDSLSGVYLVKLDELLVDNKVNHYRNLHIPDVSLPECLLPIQNTDTTMLFLSGKVYKVDTNAAIVDSLPDDFTTFYYLQSAIGIIKRPMNAVWLVNRLLLSDANYVFSYNNNLEKNDFIQIAESDDNNYSAYYNCASANDSYFYNCSTADVGMFWHGRESSIRLLKMNSAMEIIWDKKYHEDNGWYYFAFNTLATKDGGCLIAGTKNNIDSIGRDVDVFLLKVDSDGNYDTTTTLISTNESLINVYPNPGNDYLTIDTPKEYSGCVLFLYNNLGILARKKKLNYSKSFISTSELESGLYLYIIQNDDIIISKGKWIKN